MNNGCYRLQGYEIEADRYEEICDTWDYDEPGMLLDQWHVTIEDDVALLEALRARVDDLSRLKDPGFVGAPV